MAYTLDWLILFSDKSKVLTIGIVAVVGVVAGSALQSLASRSFRWEGFGGTEDTVNHLVGAVRPQSLDIGRIRGATDDAQARRQTAGRDHGADGGVAEDDDADNRGGTSIPWYSDVGPLETLGDALFGISSVVDVCLQDANVDEIYWWRVASSLLWTVDALLYLRGDFVRFSGGGRRRGGRRDAPP